MRFRTILLMLLICGSFAHAQLTYNELRVDFDSAWQYKNLKLIPVRFKVQEKDSLSIPSSRQRLISFSEAMQLHKIKVQEMQYELGADVNWLQVTNSSRQEIVIQAGEIVAGGKQDRMMAETKFIEPGTTDYIHVFCVEKRRWDDKPKTFAHYGMANSSVRKTMDITARQADVWKEIDKEFSTQKKKSETWSYKDLYKDAYSADSGYLKYFLEKYHECERNLSGFVFISGSDIMAVELFSSPDLLEITYENMLRSYIQTASAYSTLPTATNAVAKSLLDNVLMSTERQKTYVNAHGQLHQQNQKVVHLVAYP